jgi:peptide/nickel transport system substrate-binding protein
MPARRKTFAALLSALFLLLLIAVVPGLPGRAPGLALPILAEETATAGAEAAALPDLSKVKWIRRPCVDFLERLREALAREPRLATEAEALALTNDGDAANARILSALGRPPENDAEVDWDATFTRYLQADPKTLNPVFRQAVAEAFLIENVLYVTPINFDWEFKTFGDRNVVVSWETSEDHLLDRVVLRDDLTWSDGKPFTAHDIEFSWKVLMDPRVRIPAFRTLAAGLKDVKALDARTVLYLQKEALATNDNHLQWPVMPRHVYEASRKEDATLEASPYHVKMNREPVTNGPYRFVSWTTGQEIIVERREGWYKDAAGKQVRAKPYWKRVRFRPISETATSFREFTTGGLDDIQLDAVRWVGATTSSGYYDRATKLRGEQWSIAYIGWCAKLKSGAPSPFFADARVRRAMALALDHEFLMKDLLFGIYRAGVGVFHPDTWMAAKGLEPLKQDLDEAERLLDAAGWKDTDGDAIRDKVVDGAKVPFRFKLSCPDAGTGPKIAEQLKADLDRIGVKCDVQLTQWVPFQKVLDDREAQAFIMAQTTGTDPDTLTNFWTTDAFKDGRNVVGYSNPKVDALFAEGRREFDPAKRGAIYAEIARILYDDHPWTILLYQPTLWGFSKDLRGYRHSPRGFYNFAPGFLSIWKKKRAG